MRKNYVLTFICPRYLESHAGGAEIVCRDLAEKLALKGHKVEILATTALDHFKWTPEGEERSFEKHGVTVRLFHPDPRKNVLEFHRIEKKINLKEQLTNEEESLWIENSVNSDSLYQYISDHKNDVDYFIFTPYLFGLSLNGTKICPEKSLIIPCLHDESYAHLNCVKEMYQRIYRTYYNSPPEKDLTISLYGINEDKCFFLATGFDFNYTPNPEKFIKKLGIKTPYITFAGRREQGKNFNFLLEMVRVFQRIYPGKLSFVTMGSPEVPLLSSDKGNIFDIGFASEEEKYDCFAGALLNCQPSTKESFSIIVMESFLCKRPVIVNKRCHVTSNWVKLSKGGFMFKDYFSFEQIIIYALKHPEILTEMGRNGNYFAQNNFRWHHAVSRFEEALNPVIKP